ncbi:bifunctional glutamate N-acetyltransferase/amino-acid acetyltransferase ArgJ [Sinimarinibacterium sp. CAU 1509]|uniref:bifunctional glutamate N-acetyltransferase/amino-acid acetyltransferase ArgJ n=1 Tax=Sinimarinibacterium sp. CAU 1509 TaxID=2562283 RepID=UPI0010ABDD20|nr:bifunctional glutamate N-acetyltransferase/amino-acid acetyltransferase ArgJ [Sinimarinibacterium sp. CAU 1509]TJY65171.1 bifunctional glutamate N-acetyltransferase/amino-acid acetyltransferase ArgJ [Sinimarinibacterium sp. CAU 1509]
MAVNLQAPSTLLPIAGARLGVAEAAIKRPGRKDMLLIELVQGTQVAGVFTRNAFCAAPVQICREVLATGVPVRGLLINSGNANAGTGQEGLLRARRSLAAAAAALDCDAGQVLPFSTGVIGQALPDERMTAAMPRAQSGLVGDGWIAAGQAIMTTDTVMKGASRQVQTAAGTVTVTGIAKGAGMICPDMATLLAFIGTDARLSAEATQRCLQAAVAQSFNCVTVDGDTSTNDSVVLFSTGAVGGRELAQDDADFPLICDAVAAVCIELAQAVIRDGEGATRLITVEVSGAGSEAEARMVAYTLAHSPLFKTAAFAGDANWGRILAAVGRSGVPELDVGRIDIDIDDVALIRGGEPDPAYAEARGAAVFAKSEYTVSIRLGRGDAQTRIWTCDLSYDYVKINAEYRT